MSMRQILAEEMVPHAVSSECEKCGNTDIHKKEYISPGVQYIMNTINMVNFKQHIGEHLRVTCSCGWQWIMRCKTSDK